jgi:hypothetical protein
MKQYQQYFVIKSVADNTFVAAEGFTTAVAEAKRYDNYADAVREKEMLSPAERYDICEVQCRYMISDKLPKPRFNATSGFKQGVTMYDYEGNEIRQFGSQSDAARFLKVQRDAISRCIHGKQMTCKGYIFRLTKK